MPRTAFGTLGRPPSVSNSGVGRRTARPAVPSSAKIAPTTKMIPRVHRIGIWTGAGAAPSWMGGNPRLGEAASSMGLSQMSARYVCSDREGIPRSPRLGHGLGA
jgi:hypothetical protein